MNKYTQYCMAIFLLLGTVGDLLGYTYTPPEASRIPGPWRPKEQPQGIGDVNAISATALQRKAEAEARLARATANKDQQQILQEELKIAQAEYDNAMALIAKANILETYAGLSKSQDLIKEAQQLKQEGHDKLDAAFEKIEKLSATLGIAVY